MFKLGIQHAGDIIAPYFLPALYLAPVWIVLLFCNVIYVVNLASNQMSTFVASVCNAHLIYISYTIIALKVSYESNYCIKTVRITRIYYKDIGLKFSVNNRCVTRQEFFTNSHIM